MTTFVPDAVIWAATATGLRQAVAPQVPPLAARATVGQWAGVARYAATRPVDPTRDRARELADLFAASGVDHLAVLAAGADLDVDAVLAAAGEVLADQVRTEQAQPDEGLAEQVLRLCLAWHEADVAAAAPLLEVFTGHGAQPDEDPPGVDPHLLARLTAWLATRLGSEVVLERAVTIAGGFSRLMIDVTWLGPDGRTRAVVRVEQDGMFAAEGRTEVAVMRVVAAAGYRVPEVLWQEDDPAVLGAPFFVMAWVEGAARLDDDGLDDVLRDLARLHALDRRVVDAVAAVDGSVAGIASAGTTSAAATRAQLARWHAVYRAAAPHPVPLLERGFAWLERHLQATGPAVVVHGDPGPGNALHDGSGRATVIDWEFAHVGDAAEDWAYLALVRGRRLMSPQQWKDRLRTTVGLHYDDEVWAAWEAYNGVKGACVNLTALDVFAGSAHPTPDHLAIGVAVHLRFLDRVVDLTGARR